MELYHRVRNGGHRKVLELGSYKGISTVGLAYAAAHNMGVVHSVDLCDEITSAERIKYWESLDPPITNIDSYKSSAYDYLARTLKKYQFIFHDAAHGNQTLPELQLAWQKLEENGELAIHDWEQITERDSFLSEVGPSPYSSSVDKKGRHLVVFTKVFILQ